jgi:hypothetical protein
MPDLLPYFVIAEAIYDVVIHHPDGLHEGIANGRSDEVKSPLLQIVA